MSSTSIHLGFHYEFRALTMRWTTEGSCPRSRWVMAKQLKPFNLIWAERAIMRQPQSLCPNYFGEFLRFVKSLLAKPFSGTDCPTGHNITFGHLSKSRILVSIFNGKPLAPTVRSTAADVRGFLPPAHQIRDISLRARKRSQAM